MGEWGDLLALLASTAIQKRAIDQAGDRQRQAAQQMQQRQMLAQDEAAAAVARRAAQFDPETRQQAQGQVQQQLTQDYTQQVNQPQITAQGVQVGATLPEGQGGTAYLAAKAKEAQKALASSHALAALMGRIGSASELRRNESVGLGDTAQEVGRIQTHAGNQAGIDALGVQNAGQVGVGPMLASAALRGIGASGLAQAGLKPKPSYSLGQPSGPTGAWV